MFFVTAGFIAVLSSLAVPNDDEVKHTKDSYEKIMENLHDFFFPS